MSFSRASRSSIFDSPSSRPARPVSPYTRQRSTTPLPQERSLTPRPSTPPRSPSRTSVSDSPRRVVTPTQRGTTTTTTPRRTPVFTTDRPSPQPRVPSPGRNSPSRSTRSVLMCEGVSTFPAQVSVAVFVRPATFCFSGHQVHQLNSSHNLVGTTAVQASGVRHCVLCADSFGKQALLGCAGGAVLMLSPIRHGAQYIPEFKLLADVCSSNVLAIRCLSTEQYVFSTENRVAIMGVDGVERYSMNMPIAAASFSKSMLCCLSGRTVQQWSVDSFTLTLRHSRDMQHVSAVCCTDDCVFVGTDQGQVVCLVSPAEGERQRTQRADVGIDTVTRLTVAGQNHICALTHRGTLSVVDIHTMEIVQQISGGAAAVLVPLPTQMMHRHLLISGNGSCKRLSKCETIQLQRLRPVEPHAQPTSDAEKLMLLVEAQREEIAQQTALIETLRTNNNELQRKIESSETNTHEISRSTSAANDHVAVASAQLRDIVRRASLQGATFGGDLAQSVTLLEKAQLLLSGEMNPNIDISLQNSPKQNPVRPVISQLRYGKR